MDNRSESLKILQGKWLRIENKETRELEISEESITLENGQKEAIDFSRENEWAILDINQIRIFSVNAKDQLSCVFTQNGPFPGKVLVYNRVK